MNEEKENISLDIVIDKPLLPLRDVVVYPHMVIPLFVGREKSKIALEQAMGEDKKILLSSQKRSDIDDPFELYDTYGEPIIIPPGKQWVHVLPLEGSITSSN